MKILLCILIISGCSYVGFGVSKNYKKRVRLYEDLFLFCGTVKSDVSFFKTKLTEVLQKGRENAGADFCCICDVAQTSLQNSALPLITVAKINEIKCIADAEKETISNFFSILGKSDSKNQSEQIEAFEKIFFNLLQSSKEDFKNKGSLYGKLGIYTGLFVAILCL